MSQALRKLTGTLNRSDTIAIFINQLREKIGVIYGCFSYGTQVTLADGTQEKIGKIVNQKLPVEVLSWNEKTGAIEPRPIVNWFDNGPAEQFIQFEVEGGPSGRRCFAATPNHTIYTPDGEVSADELEIGDEVLVSVEDHALTDDQLPSTGGSGGAAVLAPPALRAGTAKVVKKSIMPPSEDTHRFDIEVEGNHTYLVDGVVVHNSPETTAGGRALKFYASVRLDIRRIQTLKEGETAVGNRTKVKVVKNKVAAPFREAEFDILYNEGISREGELIDFAVDKGVISKAGTWFSFGEERLGQGRENTRMFLKEHADIRAKIESKVLPMLGLKAPASPPSTNGTANGTAPEPAKAPGAPGITLAKAIAMPSAAERRK
jgi:recombination protein RecA